MWPDATGNYGRPAILSGDGLRSVTEAGHGAVNEVTALHGTREGASVRFGHVVKATFTICSLTRYTSSDAPRRKRILNGQGTGKAGQGWWVHGHWAGRAGVAHYGNRWMTPSTGTLEDRADWLVMCGSNGGGGGQMLANGVGLENDGLGDYTLHINSGWSMPGEASDFAVAEVIVWDRALTDDELRHQSSRLHHLLLGNPTPLPPPPSAAPLSPPPPAKPSTPPLPPSAPWMQSPIVRLDASDAAGYVRATGSALNMVSGAEWTMKGDGKNGVSCNRTVHNGVAVFDLDEAACYLEATERLPYCGESSHGYTTATWLDWSDDGTPPSWRALHHAEGENLLSAVYPRSRRLGVKSSGGGWREATGAQIDTAGWALILAVGQDTDCAPDGGVGGTTSFYLASPSTGPRLVGIADRSPGSGRATLYLGGPRSMAPGRVAETWAWNQALTPAQVHSFWAQTQAKYATELLKA